MLLLQRRLEESFTGLPWVILLLANYFVSGRNSRVSDYLIGLCTLVATAGWNKEALFGKFLHTLSERVQDALTMCNLHLYLDRLVDLAIQVDT